MQQVNGQRKSKTRLIIIGMWADPQATLDAYLDQRDCFYAGRQPPSETTLADVLNAFHETKQATLDEGNLASEALAEYLAVCDTIAATLNKHRPIESLGNNDFSRLRAALTTRKSGEPVSPSSQKRYITIARMVFRYANEELDLPLSRPVRYKKALRLPSAKAIRKVRNEIGERLFTVEQIRALIDACWTTAKSDDWRLDFWRARSTVRFPIPASLHACSTSLLRRGPPASNSVMMLHSCPSLPPWLRSEKRLSADTSTAPPHRT